MSEIGGEFKRARNPQFPFQTAARDPDVFNTKLIAFKKVSPGFSSLALLPDCCQGSRCIQYQAQCLQEGES